MPTKKFKDYIEKRLNKEEIAEIKRQAELEVRFIKSLQDLMSNMLSEYMTKNKIGFNELVRRLNSSPTHLAKIQKGEANLTISSMAHLMAVMDREPSDIFKIKK